MSNSDRRREIVTGLMPITRNSDGSERFFYETGNIEGSSIGDFLIKPCMKLCSHYRRSTGAFGWSALVTWADEIYRIINEGVQIDILTHLDLDQNTIKALSKFQDETAKEDFLIQKQNQILRDAIDFKKNPDRHKRSQSEVLNYLIASGQLNIKFAYLSDYDYSVPESIRAQFHMKYGYFKFDEGITLGFEGGFNETITGHHKSGESAQFMISTRENDLERLEAHIIRTDEMWENGNSKIRVRKVSEETIEHARRISKGRPIVPVPIPDVPPVGEEPETETDQDKIVFSIPEWLNYKEGDWKHQGEAVDAWMKNKKGILAMATGSGKTITSMIAANLLYQERKPLLIVVSAPYGILVDQWCDEIRDFGLEPLNIPSLKSRKEKIRAVKDLILTIKQNLTDVVIMVTTTHFLKDEKFNSLLSNAEGFQKLLIGDEVHNLGQKGFRESPPEYFDYRLGLSATPNSKFDTKRDQFLKDFFGEIVYEFGLREAIGKCLVEYDYFVHRVYLNDDEMEHWVECTKSIEMLMAMHDGDLDNPDMKAKLRERSKISSVAEGKVNSLSRALDREETQQMKHTIIYATDADPQQLVNVKSMLDDKGILHRQLTQEESRKERNEAIRLFKDEVFQILTAKRVLDEGVNVPVIKCGYILASLSQERQWTQRRGRMLRKAEGKDKAVIHDFMVLPPNNVEFKYQKKLVEREFERIKEFAELSKNYYDENGSFTLMQELNDNYLTRN
ncbi:DEAD/DEAH box helicase family protein [Gammaproteobacteria bacterium]|nr:DEAD/DEAH box helicase family protein [Gammaproteobacteria bacterium]